MAKISYAILGFFATFLIAGQADADDKAIQDCDRLAASPTDDQRTVSGVEFDDIDVLAAITACREAVKIKSLPRLEYQYARSLFKKGDFVDAYNWYLQAAEKGHANSMYNLGKMYNHGRGVTRNYAEAVRWYLQAAEKGQADAMVYLGVMYNHGRGVARNDAEAFRWFRQAAEKGQVDAMVYLAKMYNHGQGVARNDAEAVRWYRQAAEKGRADAMTELNILMGNHSGESSANQK